MIVINYKRLAEIRILHEFYLFQADGTSYFELADDGQRSQLLMDRVLGGLYNLQRDLAITPTEETKKLFRSHKMKWAPTSTGLILGTEVEEVHDGGNLEYQPVIPPQDGLVLSFFVEAARPSFRNFTNIPIRPGLPAIYYISNNNEGGQKQFPYLSLPAPVIRADKEYAMGSLAYSDASMGTLLEAIETAPGNDFSKWRPVEDGRYLNESDRVMLPHKFTYQFKPGSNTTQAEFTLRDAGGSRVKRITVSNPVPMAVAPVDFSTLDDGSVDTPATEIPAGSYTLIVKGNGGAYEETYVALLDSQRYKRQALGLIELHISRGNDDFQLLRPNGRLKTRQTPGGVEPHPVFEVLAKSRNTYWRYISNKKKDLEAEPLAAPFLNKVGRDLISANPRYLSVIPTVFQNDDPATTGVNETIFLPNPVPEALRLEGGRFYSDIHVGPLKNLIKDS